MPPFNWPRRAEPVVPPAESRDLAAVEDEIEHIDRQLLDYARIPRAKRKWAWMPSVDRLLDLRNAIRPARPKLRPSVPVIRGRTS